ncbi:hypothetical protein L209DRAFT_517591 [Thermothelomyces heterothallicus CBS 203.75]
MSHHVQRFVYHVVSFEGGMIPRGYRAVKRQGSGVVVSVASVHMRTCGIRHKHHHIDMQFVAQNHTRPQDGIPGLDQFRLLNSASPHRSAVGKERDRPANKTMRGAALKHSVCMSCTRNEPLSLCSSSPEGTSSAHHGPKHRHGSSRSPDRPDRIGSCLASQLGSGNWSSYSYFSFCPTMYVLLRGFFLLS